MSDPYRAPGERPTKRVLDATCRYCGVWGHDYLYFPLMDGGGDAGPLCESCFVRWRGVATGWRFGTVGVGMSAWPIEMRFAPAPQYDVVEVLGVYEHRSPLRCPLPGEPLYPSYKEIGFFSRLVRWFS